MSRVLVTGADGFIGSHLVERLIADGHDVTAMCFYNSNGSRGWLDNVSVLTEFGDVRDAGFMSDLIGRGFDIVYHLAALIDVPYSYAAPESYIQTNVGGTLNVLRAAQWAGSPRLVLVSSSEVYGTPETVPIRESHPINPQSPYAASKVAADALAMAYWRSFDVDVRIVRPFNTYGPRQSTRGVVAAILSQIDGESVDLGSLEPRRDLTYVSDTVDGIVKAADLPAGEVVHLGTGRSVSIGELFDLCCKVTGLRPHLHAGDPSLTRPAASEVMHLLSDPSKAKRLMGWEAKVSLEEGIEATWSWFPSRS